MSEQAIQVRNLGKRYQLGLTQSDTLTDVAAGITRRAAELFTNRANTQGNNDQLNTAEKDLWAVRDISFDVRRGEVFGIVGRNGAGKSTLLKLISRVTSPTTGRIDIWGRVASLLEVGTGFHPDLTGRENIYMNATLLGMTRHEVNQKLEQIIDFAGVDRFLDTQVKRYSSGMRVRLGFAVAAHLNPEILIIDEVLTVGDAEFQKKCLGKMDSVAKSGRTVLFVSHNMAAVRSLCTRGCILERGTVSQLGQIEQVIQQYLGGIDQDDSTHVRNWPADACIAISSHAQIKPIELTLSTPEGQPRAVFSTDQPIQMRFRFSAETSLENVRVGIAVRNAENVLLFGANTTLPSIPHTETGRTWETSCVIPNNLLNRGKYEITLGMDQIPWSEGHYEYPGCVSFEVVDIEGSGINAEPLPGVIRPKLMWKSIRTDGPH